LKVFSYMIEAHIFRENEKGIEFLLLKRSDQDIYPGVWQMVTGSVIRGEKGYEAVVREIKEETGLIPEKLWVVPNVNSFYSKRRDHLCMVPVFAALVNNKSEINISVEHTEFKWVDKNTAKNLLAWVGQRKSVDIIYDYFSNEINFLNFEEIDLKKLNK
jgi:dATP pyrophosphohydrolase